MSELRNILQESVARVFADQVDNDFLTEVEENGWPSALWDTVSELGLPQVLVSEEAGGMGGSWADAYIIVRQCGYAGVPLPVPEAIVAAWIAERAGLELPAGAPGLIPCALDQEQLADNTYSGEIDRIPWGRDSAYYLGITNNQEVVILARQGVEIQCQENLGRDPRDRVSFTNTALLDRSAVDLPANAVRWLCALIRSAQIAGASARCLEISVKYVGEREQFGRTLSRFQAVQHKLAMMAGSLATVESMSATAFQAMDHYGIGTNGRDAEFEIAAAKCRASDTVESITRIAHQVHGAIGFTYEYGLHFLTRRLWSWRAEFGGRSEWAQYLGEIAKQQGGDKIWAYITN